MYAAPPQRSLDLGPDPGGLNAFVTMDDPVSDDYIVKDISPGRDFRRWAFIAPELRFRLKEPRHLNFAVDFAIPEVTYKVTGPVTVSYAVNGQTLGVAAVRPAWRFPPGEAGAGRAGSTGGKQVHVTFQATPRWISPEDGAQLSFLLRSAGFTQ